MSCNIKEQIKIGRPGGIPLCGGRPQDGNPSRPPPPPEWRPSLSDKSGDSFWRTNVAILSGGPKWRQGKGGPEPIKKALKWAAVLSRSATLHSTGNISVEDSVYKNKAGHNSTRGTDLTSFKLIFIHHGSDL
jgi:hypothetical protein